MRKIIGKRVGTCLLVFSMLFTGSGMTAMAKTTLKRGTDVETKTGSIVLDGNDIKADNVNGLTYKGFGMLSGNSTSDLLLDYKTQNPVKYAELMQYLFGGEYPIFTHVKLEMGNDRNNSTGPESATMRTKGESANVMLQSGLADRSRCQKDQSESKGQYFKLEYTDMGDNDRRKILLV